MPTPTEILKSEVAFLKEELAKVHEKLDSLFQVGPDKQLAVTAPVADLPESILNEFGPSDPIPLLQREAVDQALNKSFGIHSKASQDAAQFSFTIIVPDKYSTLTPDQKALQHRDIRLKVLTYAEGLNGVKEWADLVFKNFDSSRQAMIVADRV